MIRETRTVKENEIFRIACNWYNLADEDFYLVKRELTSSDHEDGGGHYRLILKEKSSGKYFEYYYTDWDIDNTEYDEDDDIVDGRCDLGTNLSEVFPESITIIEYN